ncbi:rubrerythrin [Saccharococcus thermophilus]|uniref:Rubrerythrin n=1 Tax=Saccharococcus thermophilus TaxID=29396 RepID=A0A846MJS1_9BACL|nr:rubrerythrin [Saccharococcus thermophilus]
MKEAIKQYLPFAMIAPDAQFANVVVTFLTILEAKTNGKA